MLAIHSAISTWMHSEFAGAFPVGSEQDGSITDGAEEPYRLWRCVPNRLQESSALLVNEFIHTGSLLQSGSGGEGGN
ncbi:MAG: hypothetical protein B7Z37_09900 [Verrucomicrobia bacterium 12-59-8]|nr:MAG: hypothetical protein B7Z37_09900 [Verrucomicrobia bacterium 12-59-8]